MNFLDILSTVDCRSLGLYVQIPSCLIVKMCEIRRRSQRGCSGCTCIPGRWKKIRRNLQGKCVSAPPAHQVHPLGRARANFRTFFAGRRRFGRLFSRFRPSFERATTKKGSSTFLRRKVHSPRQNSGYAYGEIPLFLWNFITYNVCRYKCLGKFCCVDNSSPK